MMIHPTVSSMIAEARINCPILRRMKSASMITMATIFTDEMERAVARNSAVTIRFSGSGSIESGSISPRNKPQANGKTIPESEENKAVRRIRLTIAKSVSIPAINNSIKMPNCEMASIIFFCSAVFGKIT